MSSPKYEWCENVNATAQSNILMYQLIKVLNDGDHSDNKFVHPCPYTVKTIRKYIMKVV